MNIRHCLASGLTVEVIAREISEAYRNAPSEDKESLGKLLTAVYDFSDRETAIRCGRLFNLFPAEGPEADRSISYQILKQCFKDQGYIKWLDQYPNNPNFFKSVKRSFCAQPYLIVVPPLEKQNLITICERANMYCALDPSMTVHLISIFPFGELVEIEEYDDDFEPDSNWDPVYTSENNMYISPIFRVRMAKRVLEYCLERVGFPYVDISMKVFFTDPDTSFTNKEQFVNSQSWKECEIYQAKELDKMIGFLVRCPNKNFLRYSKDKIDQEMLRVLTSSIKAMAMMYYQRVFSGKLYPITHEVLDELSEDLELYESFWK